MNRYSRLSSIDMDSCPVSASPDFYSSSRHSPISSESCFPAGRADFLDMTSGLALTMQALYTGRDAGRVRIDVPGLLQLRRHQKSWGWGTGQTPKSSPKKKSPREKKNRLAGRPKHEIQNALKGRREGRPNHPVNHVFSAPACASIASFVVSAASVIKPGG